MVESFERRTTQSRAIFGIIHRTGAIFGPASLSVAQVTLLHFAPSGLAGPKIASGRRVADSVNRP